MNLDRICDHLVMNFNPWTSHDQTSAPLAVPVLSASPNWKYAYDEVGILPPKHQSTLQSVEFHLFTCGAENGVQCFGDADQNAHWNDIVGRYTLVNFKV
jgi:hypothetical protein